MCSDGVYGMKRLVLIGLTAAFSITLGACSTFAPKVDMPEKTTVSQQVQQPAQVAMAAGVLAAADVIGCHSNPYFLLVDRGYPQRDKIL